MPCELCPVPTSITHQPWQDGGTDSESRPGGGSPGPRSLEIVFVNLLLAPLRPLADVLDLTAEALAAVGTVSVAALGLVLAEETERAEHGHLRVVSGSSTR